MLRLFLALLLTTVFAQTGTTVPTGSGSTETSSVSSESDALKADRALRADGLRIQLTKDKKAETEFRTQFAAFIAARAALRSRCRDDLRRSNKNTKFPTLTRCYTDDLALEKELLEKRRTRLENMPGVSDAVRNAALSKLDALTDAVDTIMFALESNVYGVPEDLSETKKSLLEKYRMPYWDAMLLARADRALSLASSLILRIDALPSPETYASARSCLATEESALRLLLKPKAKKATPDVRASLDAVQQCVTLLHTLTTPASGSGSVSS